MRRWVIRFLGGAWCWDKGSCATRSKEQPYLMSTAMLPANTSAEAHEEGIPDEFLRSAGITSIEPWLNPAFFSWAHVHIWYCSSDSYLADIAPGRTRNACAVNEHHESPRRDADLPKFHGLSATMKQCEAPNGQRHATQHQCRVTQP